MMRRCVCRWMTVHTPRAIPFEIGKDDATAMAVKKYKSRWILGASTEYIEMKAPIAEFVPFFFCNGAVRATYYGQATYNTSRTDSKGNTSSSTHTTTTGQLNLNSNFYENATQIYGGYKYNNKHIYSALRQEQNAIKKRKISEVDVSVGQIGLYEVSINTMKTLLMEDVKSQMTRIAEQQVRQFHATANSISITFTSFDVDIEDVYPTYVPCHVIKANYDGEEFTVYVSGSEGTVGGPYLINALQIARIAAIGTFASTMALYPVKAYAFVFGSVGSVATYLVAFYAAKYFPALRRDYFRRQREAERNKNKQDDDAGFKPSKESQRISEEYRRSSYWDNHKYEQKRETTFASDGTFNDSRGYYRLIGVTPAASVNDIRSAYRQRVLMEHPDAGGSTERMQKLNEAYRVLRDAKLRDAYDKS